MNTKIWMGAWELAGKAIVVVLLSLLIAANTYKSDPAFLDSFAFTAFIFYIMIAGVLAMFELVGRALGMALERVLASRLTGAAHAPSQGQADIAS